MFDEMVRLIREDTVRRLYQRGTHAERRARNAGAAKAQPTVGNTHGGAQREARPSARARRGEKIGRNQPLPLRKRQKV